MKSVGLGSQIFNILQLLSMLEHQHLKTDVSVMTPKTSFNGYTLIFCSKMVHK